MFVCMSVFGPSQLWYSLIQIEGLYIISPQAPNVKVVYFLHTIVLSWNSSYSCNLSNFALASQLTTVPPSLLFLWMNISIYWGRSLFKVILWLIFLSRQNPVMRIITPKLMFWNLDFLVCYCLKAGPSAACFKRSSCQPRKRQRQAGNGGEFIWAWVFPAGNKQHMLVLL